AGRGSRRRAEGRQVVFRLPRVERRTHLPKHRERSAGVLDGGVATGTSTADAGQLEPCPGSFDDTAAPVETVTSSLQGGAGGVPLFAGCGDEAPGDQGGGDEGGCAHAA